MYGRRTSESISGGLDYALAPATPKTGGGRAMEEGWWCRNIATWFEYRRVSEQGDFARADELMAEPACPPYCTHSGRSLLRMSRRSAQRDQVDGKRHPTHEDFHEHPPVQRICQRAGTG